jgi:hypothetical protein
MALRRSARNFGRTFDYTDSTSLYPDGPPIDELEILIKHLNMQAFPSSSYARVDDILVYSLFATKRRPGHCRALTPLMAGNGPEMTQEEAVAMANAIRLGISSDRPTKAECNATALELCSEHPTFLVKDDFNVVEQQVTSPCDLYKR